MESVSTRKRRTRRATCLAAGTTAVILLVGCATIIHGTTQDVGISSIPSGAQVTVNNVSHGTTPVVASLKRKDNHVVRIELEGYEPFEATLTRQVSGWIWGNILFGGIIGLVVDAVSGGLYKLNPKQISAAMQASGQAALVGDEGLFVLVTLEADPTWERISQLTPQAP